MQKHPLLYDYSTQKILRKRKFMHRAFFLYIYTLLLSGCSLIFRALFFHSISYILGNWYGLFTIVSIIFILTMCSYLIVKVVMIKDLKVYENGIISPFRSFSQILRRRENFIPFSQVETVYPNKRQNLKYVTIVLKGNDPYPIDKKWIYDLDKFVNVLKDRVKVIEDIDYIVVRK